MRTNIEIDDKLMSKAMKASGLDTKKAVVEQALVEMVERRQRREFLALAGKVDFAPGYDHKALRRGVNPK